MNDSKQKSSGAVTKLWHFAKACKGKLVASVLIAIVGVMFGMVPYLSVAKLTAAFFEESQTASIVIKWGVIAVIGFVLKMVLTTWSSMVSHEAAFTILQKIREKLTKKMERVPMGVMIDTPVGTLKALVVDTVDKLEKPLAHIFPEMISNIFAPVAILVMLFILDWRMGLATIATVPVGFIILMGQMIGYKEKSERYIRAGNEMNNAIVEYVNGIEVIKAFNQSASSYGKFTHAVKFFRDSTLDWWRGCWIFSSIGYTVISSTLLFELPLGAYWFKAGSLDFSTFITCVILSLGIAGPIMAATQFVDDFAVIYQSVNQVMDFLDQEEMIRPTELVKLSGAEFEFKNVCFGYNETEILHDINLKTAPHGVTAIVGPSGGGKSTLAKLMAGFWNVTSGEIIFGEQDIKNIPFAQLMENVSYVAQDNFLFDISIKENIRMGRVDATDEEVYAAAKAADCHDFIMKLENGYDTRAGEAGGKLSGGERQRITIARAMLKKANVVILDEATAYADPENEAIVQEAINRLIAGKTLIVIAHRLSTIKNADKIVVVKKGKIVAEGRQEELLKSCELYRKMWTDHITAMDGSQVEEQGVEALC